MSLHVSFFKRDHLSFWGGVDGDNYRLSGTFLVGIPKATSHFWSLLCRLLAFSSRYLYIIYNTPPSSLR